MQYITKGLIALAALAFLLAVVGSLLNIEIIQTSPEAFSRASNNLALIALGLAICFKEQQ
jgi:hypothetical protein